MLNKIRSLVNKLWQSNRGVVLSCSIKNDDQSDDQKRTQIHKKKVFFFFFDKKTQQRKKKSYHTHTIQDTRPGNCH